jgi:hypothetical protein
MVVVNNNSTTESPLYFGEGIDKTKSFPKHWLFCSLSYRKIFELALG